VVYSYKARKLQEKESMALRIWFEGVKEVEWNVMVGLKVNDR